MKLVVVGGSSRDIGKTAVVAGLIRALRRYQWTAIKLSQYGNQPASGDGEEADSDLGERPYSIDEETDRSGKTDTSRFLDAGARRALWVRMRQEMLPEALAALQAAIGNDQYIIVESNSILRYWRASVYLTVLDPLKKDFKASARELLPRADACLVLEPGFSESAWDGIPLELVSSKPLFPLRRDCSITAPIVSFVEARLLPETSPP